MLLLDRLVNLISGLGTSKDKAVGNGFALNLISKAELDALYRSEWLARKIVDIIPFDMTREWRDWQADEQAIEKLEEAERLLRVRDKVACALQRARLYGGAVIYVGIAGQRPETPLNVETVRAGSLEYIHVLHRWEITSGEVDRDPLSPFFGEPAYYEIRGSKQASARIHPSRIIRFVGASLPDPMEAGEPWGDPVLQVVYDAVQNAASSQQHIAGLLPEAKVDVIKVPGLSEALSTQDGTAKVTARFSAANQIKSMFNMLLLEGDGESGETWEQKTIQFGQFPDLMRLFLQVAAGAADIPVTRLLGQSPAGLNSTGESDTRNYYDHLASLQNVQLRPAIDRLDEILIRHALGARPADIYYEWAPLWQLSETEKATVAKARAEATHIYAVDATIPAPVLHEAIRNQLIESGDYPGIEKAYEDFDAGLLEPVDDPALDPGGEGQGETAPLADSRKGFDPSQPRVPAGSPDGGEWTSGHGGGLVSSVEGLLAAEVAAINDYTGAGYKAMNWHLRHNGPGGPEMDAKIAALDGVLNRASLPEDMVVHRGIGTVGTRKIEAMKLRKGDVLDDPGFMSTTRSVGVARSFAQQSREHIILEIKVRRGAKALDISSVSDAGPGEQEVLFARGSKLKMVSWDKKSRVLKMEHIDG